MKSRAIFQSVLALLVTAALGAGVALSAGRNANYGAHLSATSSGSKAQGQFILRFSPDGSEAYFKLIVANIENVTMAHIHAAGGGPVVWLYPDGPPPKEISGTTNGVLSEGTFDASDLVGGLAGQTLEDLVDEIEGGTAFVNVHTTQNPGGEIRGNIR